jgi:hypothetical protein
VSPRFRLIISTGLGLLTSLALGGTFVFWQVARHVQTEMRPAIAIPGHIVQTAVSGAISVQNRNDGKGGCREGTIAPSKVAGVFL